MEVSSVKCPLRESRTSMWEGCRKNQSIIISWHRAEETVISSTVICIAHVHLRGASSQDILGAFCGISQFGGSDVVAWNSRVRGLRVRRNCTWNTRMVGSVSSTIALLQEARKPV